MDLSNRPFSIESKSPNFRKNLVIEVCKELGLEVYGNMIYDAATGLIFGIGVYGDIIGINDRVQIFASIHKYAMQNRFKYSSEVKIPETVFIPFNANSEIKYSLLEECKDYAKNLKGESLVKPNSLSLSKGVSYCQNYQEVLEGVEFVWNAYQADTLVQEFVDGIVYRVVSYNGQVEMVFDHNTGQPCRDKTILKKIEICNHEVAENCKLTFYGADLIYSDSGFYFLEVNDLPHINHLNRFCDDFDKNLYRKMIQDIMEGKVELNV
jgi:glutathione synthase/RimK-type ligase-like ATP-grasp enzyme